MLFMGDNGETDAAYEGIFPLLQDGLKTTSWGTTLFLLASTYDQDMHAIQTTLQLPMVLTRLGVVTALVLTW